jgi:hypothetical protein
VLSMKETPFTLEGSHRHAQARAVDIESGLVRRHLAYAARLLASAVPVSRWHTCSQQVSSVAAFVWNGGFVKSVSVRSQPYVITLRTEGGVRLKADAGQCFISASVLRRKRLNAARRRSHPDPCRPPTQRWEQSFL